MQTFQELILALQNFWANGCALLQPYDIEVGAGTFHTATFLRAIGPEPWNAAYVQPSRRPKDGRYGENPNRLQHYYQYQVVLKPSPDEHPGTLPRLAARARHRHRASTTSASSRTTGNRRRWAPGAWAGKCGWTAWKSRSSPISRKSARLSCKPVLGEITYGLERLAMYLQGVENVFDLVWTHGRSYLRRRLPPERSRAVEVQLRAFQRRNAVPPVRRIRIRSQAPDRGRSCVLPGYEMVMKCSHTFNLLDARGAISVTERAAYIGRVRALARAVAQAYYESRERLGLPDGARRRECEATLLVELLTEELPPKALRSLAKRSPINWCRRSEQAAAHGSHSGIARVLCHAAPPGGADYPTCWQQAACDRKALGRMGPSASATAQGARRLRDEAQASTVDSCCSVARRQGGDLCRARSTKPGSQLGCRSGRASLSRR